MREQPVSEGAVKNTGPTSRSSLKSSRRARVLEAGPIRLFSGPGVELYEDGTVHLGAAHIIMPGGSMNTVEVSWVEMRLARLDAPVQTETAIAELSADLRRHLVEALDRFADLFEASRV